VAEQQQQPKFRIQDNSSIIETYANKCLGAVFDGSAVNLTFGSLRVPLEKTDEGPIQSQQPVVQVTHRLTLSPAAAIELINGLNATFTALRQAQAQAQRVAQTGTRLIGFEGMVSKRASPRPTAPAAHPIGSR
jgi:hypothetical protein